MGSQNSCCLLGGSNTYFLHQMQSHTFYKMQFSGFFLLIFYFSLLKYTYHYNYRSHISLQVAKLAKSAGVQILIFPTVYTTTHLISISLTNSLTHTLSHTHPYLHIYTHPHKPTHSNTHTHTHTRTHTHT